MNPLTDLTSKLQLPDGSFVEVVQPGARVHVSKNWRLTEAAYRRYESHIREAIKHFPKETRFDVPSGMSPNTFVHRLRDALQAVIMFGYDIDVQLSLKDIRAELTVCMDQAGTGVWIRAKGKPGRPVKMQLGTANERPGYIGATILPSPSEEVLRAFCILAATGNRHEPVQFKGPISAELQEEMTRSFDTAFAYDNVADVTTMI